LVVEPVARLAVLAAAAFDVERRVLLLGDLVSSGSRTHVDRHLATKAAIPSSGVTPA